jgi:hypothetical protein
VFEPVFSELSPQAVAIARVIKKTVMRFILVIFEYLFEKVLKFLKVQKIWKKILLFKKNLLF